MYMTKNVYQRNTTYYDGKDIEIFHYLLEKAKSTFIENSAYFEGLSDDELSALKKNDTPVIFASTVSAYKAEFDFSMIRSDMNDRALRQYLIIDADFDAGQEDSAKYLHDKMIEVAEKFNTPLIIYPTASYPKKPRFRAVMFTKQKLNASGYYQAMSWWYAQLGILNINKNESLGASIFETLEGLDKDLVNAADASNTNIRSNNNAPFFVNFAQLDYIYDTTQDDSLVLLDKSLWADYTKPKLKKKPTFGDNNQMDNYTLSDEYLEKATHEFAKTPFAQDYSTFWRFLHSLARAEDKKQLTPEQVDKVLNWVAETGEYNDKELLWKLNNKTQYNIEKNRVLSIPSYYKSARPLCTYPIYKELLLEDLGYDDTTVLNSKKFDFDDTIDKYDKAEVRKKRPKIAIKSKKSKKSSNENVDDTTAVTGKIIKKVSRKKSADGESKVTTTTIIKETAVEKSDVTTKATTKKSKRVNVSKPKVKTKVKPKVTINKPKKKR